VSATTYGWLILAFPLAGTFITAATYKGKGNIAGWLGTLSILLSFAAALGALFVLLDRPVDERQLTSSLWDFADAGTLKVQLNILVDPLSVYMALVVSAVSTLIHLYSIAYMRGDQGYSRFFSYLNFFVFSMLLLVLAGNLVLLIVGWAFVGYASYALISYWYRRETATKAGMKAFVINVIGDVGMVVAAFFIFRELGTFDLLSIFDRAPGHFDANGTLIVAICCLLLVGAFAKSAQLPLHTWLPDAMEGPTPVSSLIHAATMVTAGVYLIARFHVLFEIAPTAADIAAFIGLATLLFAATVAIVQTDLKRIIAYSTMSQIGYMVVGVSIGAYSAGMFHLLTHAFFKALLFMAAGSVIAAMANEQNIDRMGGFKKSLPLTIALLTIGSLALAGFPGTSGFFSKDEILAFAVDRGGMYWVFAIGGYLGALLTAIYSFRLVFRVGWGEEVPESRELREGHMHHASPANPATGEAEDFGVGFPGEEHHVAEQNPSMWVAMSVLGFGALFLGLLQIPGVDDVIHRFLHGSFEDSSLYNVEVPDSTAYKGLVVGGLIAIIGISTAALIWLRNPGIATGLMKRLKPLHTFLFHKWYFDELINAVVVAPVLAIGRFCNNVIERFLVDGLVVTATGFVKGVGGGVRTAQSGYMRSYALLLITGFAGLALYFLISGS
jgi:NADH-quinone oxidoreductase subunit L